MENTQKLPTTADECQRRREKCDEPRHDIEDYVEEMEAECEKRDGEKLVSAVWHTVTEPPIFTFGLAPWLMIVGAFMAGVGMASSMFALAMLVHFSVK